MLGKRREVTSERRDVVARGGVSLGGVLTGVVVAFGAGFILTAIVAGILTALGAEDENLTRGDLVRGGIGAGIALVIVQFLAYLWGGYTAGRMARGAGALNGLLVPLTAIVIGIIVGALVAALGAEVNVENVNLPFSVSAWTDNANVQEWGLGLGIAALIAMFLGGLLGGGLGSRWHSKLERNTFEKEAVREEGRADARREAELRRQDETATARRESDRPPSARE